LDKHALYYILSPPTETAKAKIDKNFPFTICSQNQNLRDQVPVCVESLLASHPQYTSR